MQDNNLEITELELKIFQTLIEQYLAEEPK